jgi:hypothetical protein
MILNARSNQFIFSFPRAFVPEEVSKKYQPYIDKIPGNLISRPIDIINYSVQSVGFPTFNYDPLQQQFRTDQKWWRSSMPLDNIVNNDITVTFQLLDGYLNYWMMLDLFLYYYAFDNPNSHGPAGTALRIIDSEGNIMITLEFMDMLYKEIGSLELSYSNNSPEFSTFDCQFTFDSLASKVELDGK